MCFFGDDELGGPYPDVSETRIFARGDGARQHLVYSMHLVTTRETAMILPLPVPANSPEDAVHFIDLSDYGNILGDIERCFQEGEGDPDIDDLFADDEPPVLLEVHSVGDFEASYVPRMRDFARVDPRFRLPDRIWQQLPMYEDWGFAVIRLKEGRRVVHPIALTFPRRWPDCVYFPTTHVHDGQLHDEAFFDHMLYYQGMPAPVRSGAGSDRGGRFEALYPPAARIKIGETRGIVDAGLSIERLRVHGTRPNEDVWLLPRMA